MKAFNNIAFNKIDEANELGKSALNKAFLKHFVEARILGYNANKKLVFFFEKPENVKCFTERKEQIKEKLRGEYKKNFALYKEQNFIFYDIEAKTADERLHRTKEEEQILERGIAKIQAILDRHKTSKVA